MPTNRIIITNILSTGTAFGVRYDQQEEGVFIPAAVSKDVELVRGSIWLAMLVPNKIHIDTTPWVAITLQEESGEQPQKQKPDMKALEEKILRDLQEGRATPEEIAESISEPLDVAAACIKSMLQRGLLREISVVDLSHG